MLNISMSHSGLTDKAYLNVYVRKACLDLVTFLNGSEKVKMVTGCPGVGKSVEVFSYAMEHAQGQNKRVLYVHGSGADGISVLFKDDPTSNTAFVTKLKLLELEDESPRILHNFILTILREGRVDLIVLDGALSWLIRKVYFEMKNYPQAFLLTCTSFQALGKISQEDYCRSALRSNFEMDSWEEYEYDDAVCKGALVLQPDVTVKEMFYYVGGCVRLFQSPISFAVTLLEDKMKSAPDMGKLVGSGGVGDKSADATNSLMAIYGGRSTILSQFVTRKLMLNSLKKREGFFLLTLPGKDG